MAEQIRDEPSAASPLTGATVVAHRGFSSRQPEMTAAAYRAAIDYARQHRVTLGLECDVHFSADDELICLHDLTVDRTSSSSGAAIDATVAELQQIDFGPGAPVDDPAAHRLVTLAELMAWTRTARDDGVDVNLVVETKHPNPRGLDVERRLADMITRYGWHRRRSPVRVISFSLAALEEVGELLPHTERGLLVEDDLADWTSGRLPDGVRVVGPDIRLLRQAPDWVARLRRFGNAVNVWTANTVEDITWCRDLGVTGFTTDYPDRVFDLLERTDAVALRQAHSA